MARTLLNSAPWSAKRCQSSSLPKRDGIRQSPDLLQSLEPSTVSAIASVCADVQRKSIAVYPSISR